MKEKIQNFARTVATDHKLTGHGANTFARMVEEVFVKVESLITDQIAAGIAKGIKAERERLATVLDSPEAQGREQTARKLALQSDMTVEQIAQVLAATPMAHRDPLGELMAGRSPGISSDDGEHEPGSDQDETEAATQYILNAGK